MNRPLVRRSITLIPLLVLTVCLVGCAELLSTLPEGGAGDRSTPQDGLREALRVGTGRATQQLGREDGYLGNPAVRIVLPEKFDTIARALRTIGAGHVVDQFVTSMNRAAEAAAPRAKEIFVAAIREMTFADAMAILRGSGQEATNYLRRHAGPRLTAAFQPIVSEKLDSVGVTRRFDELVEETSRLPFLRKPVFDLETYVTGEAVEGLFLVIGREEEKIRRDPLARTTYLLRKYFGGGGGGTQRKTP